MAQLASALDRATGAASTDAASPAAHPLLLIVLQAAVFMVATTG